MLCRSRAAQQTAIHTELGGTLGSGNCDRNGCFQKIGGPMSLPSLREAYGPGKTIDSMRPFDVAASVSKDGSFRVALSQGAGRTVTSFDHKVAGNPQGKGVPRTANPPLLGSVR